MDCLFVRQKIYRSRKINQQARGLAVQPCPALFLLRKWSVIAGFRRQRSRAPPHLPFPELSRKEVRLDEQGVLYHAERETDPGH